MMTLVKRIVCHRCSRLVGAVPVLCRFFAQVFARRGVASTADRSARFRQNNTCTNDGTRRSLKEQRQRTELLRMRAQSPQMWAKAGSVNGGIMRRSVAAILLAGLLVLAGRTAWPADAQTGGCQLAPVFMMLRDLVGRDRIGECVGPVIRNDVGELSQQTALGMMTFRPSDMVTTFTDGQTAWLFGPRGLESRPSNSRLAWETGGATGAGTAMSSTTGSSNTGTTSSASTTAGPGAGASTTTGASSVSPNGASAVGVSSVSSASPGASQTTIATGQAALPIRLDGSNSSTSSPFDLTGGDYRVTWEIERQRGNVSCYVGARLRRAETSAPGTLVLHTTLNTSNDSTSSGESRLFAVQPGRYVLDVTTTGCSWKIGLHAPR
jgi:hypothetical protein